MTGAFAAWSSAEPVGSNALREAVDAFAEVDPALLERRALLARADTKFMLPLEALPGLLRALRPHHGVILAGAERIATYDTDYFDLPALRAYDDHVRGRAPRHKVRARHYPDRGVSFLEVKCRTNRGRTEKLRRPHPFGQRLLSEEEVDWALRITGWPGRVLLPQARTRFQRIALAALDSNERVTVDVGLRLERPPSVRSLDGLAIVEVKQGSAEPRSASILALRRAGARSRSLSKYAVAIGLMAPGVRRNRLLPTLREIERYT